MTCQIDSGEHGDVASLEHYDVRTARKPHKCCECQETIRPGENYEVSRLLYDGRWDTFKTCSLCLEIRNKVFCSWIFGTIWEDLANEDVFSISLAELSVPAIEKIESFWKSIKA